MTTTARPVDPYLLDILRRFWRSNHRMPTYSEMTRIFGYRSKNAAFRLAKKLIDEGYIEKDEGGRLMPKGERLGVPLLGYVQAGFPTPAEEELIDTLSLDEYLVENPDASFMLKVSGDSMIDAGIHEDDIVIVERGKNPKNGDMVLACVDNEWTLKHYHKRGKSIELHPANENYPIIRPRGELTLGGIVKSMVRRYY